ncbi:hypothetical protein [Nannocystis pusilla]|uniref:Uncharacterized protein n=1 Tax=Nannocystis pusilla TaxID=889268 RepID=A0ABS7TRS8_9BACT|nr:hypothetical protein [Nannocystis pusilla]MBZ5710876.1 hypothetical protein [Nannocystis pusilla]
MRRAALTFFVFGLSACPQAPGDDATWEIVEKGLPGSLMSVWGRGADDVWIVGADAGSGPAVKHWDGAAWSELDAGSPGHLWWVSGLGDGVWMSGDAGRVLRYDRNDMSSKTWAMPTTERLYGVFPLAEDDVWACGSDEQNTAGVIWRYDGDVWAAPADLTPELMAGFACFKIWGSGPDDLWFVGYGGVVLRYQGGTWSRIELPADRPLFTVHGAGGDVFAVGGAVSGYIVELGDAGARDVTPKGEVPQFAGIYAGESATVAAGLEGAIWQRGDDGVWTEIEAAPTTPLEYHAVYVDPDGGIWAVGGRIYTGNLSDGLLTHYGPPLPQ